jgi:hypothetical protein
MEIKYEFKINHCSKKNNFYVEDIMIEILNEIFFIYLFEKRFIYFFLY